MFLTTVKLSQVSKQRRNTTRNKHAHLLEINQAANNFLKTKRTGKCSELYDNYGSIYTNFWNVMKTVLREKYTVLNAYKTKA